MKKKETDPGYRLYEDEFQINSHRSPQDLGGHPGGDMDADQTWR